MTCPTCSIPNLSDDKYCRECGTRLPPPLAVPAATDGEDPQVIGLLADAASALDAGEPERAATAVQAALAVQPGSAAAHSALAVVYERQGRIDAAVEHVRRALELDPSRTADERRMQALLSHTAGAGRTGIASPKLALAAAAVVATVVFGGGLLVLASNQQGGESAEARASGVPIMPSTAVTAAPTPAPAPATTAVAAPRTMPSVPIPITPNRPGSPVVVPTPAAPRRPAFPPATAGAPGERVGLPPVVNRPPIQGLPAAAIGEVVPLPPSAASGGVDQPQSPLQPPAGSGAALPQAGAVPSGPVTPPTAAANTRPRVEPLETETGFIKIEVGGNRREEPAPAPAQPLQAPPAQQPGGNRGTPTGISLQFSSGVTPVTPQGGELDAARRAQRTGLDWLRKGQVAPAKQHLAQALRLYELAAVQNGPGQEEAKQGAATCRRALAALR